jgi:N-acetylneuraminic acid mutarotase
MLPTRTQPLLPRKTKVRAMLLLAALAFFWCSGCSGSHSGSPSDAPIADPVTPAPDSSIPPWQTKTPIPTPRTNAAAVAVDGNIYVIGGSTSPKAVEQYNPATDTWVTKSPMPTARYSTAAAVVDGKIYVIGGTANVSTMPITLTTVEQYDPATDTWTVKSPMPSRRWNTAATVVDGKIYVIGGLELIGWCGTVACTYVASSNRVEQYDPATDTWIVKTPLPTARGTCAAAAVDGKIYVVGSLKDVQSYDPATDTWITRSPMPIARSDMVADVVDGKIYVIGGTTNVGANTGPGASSSRTFALTTVEQYDPATDTWTTKSPMPTGRYEMAAAVVDGKIYVIGGTQSWVSSSRHEPIDSVEQYDPAHDAFSRRAWVGKAPMPTARYAMAAAVADGKIYVIGGNPFLLQTVEQYDPATDTWTTKSPMPTGRMYLVAAVVNSKVYAIGGQREASSFLQTVEEYDPATDTWTTKSPMPTGRYAMAAAVVDGKIYVIGGTTNGPFNPKAVEQYDPATDTWTTKSPMPTARSYMAAAVVDGKIYVIGGRIPFGGGSNSNEQYDPATDTWTTKAILPDSRYGLAAAAVNGKVYTIGGSGGSTYTDLNDVVREYDPAADTWTTKSPMPTGRIDFAATTFNGRIYAIGGHGPVSGFFNRVEEYDPARDP